MLERMIDKRPQADRLLVAEIWGEARRRAQWRELGSDEEAAAVAALRELADGRADLLAEVAGILEGAREGEPDEPLARQAAELCRKAGADPEAIPAWVAEGRRRRAAANQPPFSGGLHGGGARRTQLPPLRKCSMIPSGEARKASSRARLRAVAASTTTPSSGGSRPGSGSGWAGAWASAARGCGSGLAGGRPSTLAPA